MADRNPWGGSAYSALRWAYGLLARSESAPNVLADMRSGTKRRGDDMTPLDYRAQGALIRQVAEKLHDQVLANHLTAVFLPKPIKERVPGGKIEIVDRFADMRQPAVYAVAWFLLGQAGTGAQAISGYMELESQYCLKRHNNRRLARALKVRYDAAKEAREQAYIKLDALLDAGLDAVQSKLEAKGLV